MSDPTPKTGPEETASLAQQELLESCLELVFETQEAALADGVDVPVILLLDCEDEIGAEIANAWLGAETVRNAVAEQQLDSADGRADHLADDGAEGELTTVYARAFSWAESQREVPKVFDYLAPVFEMSPPAEGFLAIAVTAGGASVFTVPLSAGKS